ELDQPVVAHGHGPSGDHHDDDSQAQAPSQADAALDSQEILRLFQAQDRLLSPQLSHAAIVDPHHDPLVGAPQPYDDARLATPLLPASREPPPPPPPPR